MFLYAALLPRRGPHIASHSVCLSVRPSRACILKKSVTCFRQPCGRAVSFVLFTCAGRIKYGDQPHKLVRVIDHKARTRNYYMCIVHDIKTTQTTSISLCLASASSSLSLPLPCLASASTSASASTKLPRAHPWA